MSHMIRTQGYDSVIWKLLDPEPAHYCPECNSRSSFNYIGYAENYSDDLHARIYVCKDCGAWLDCAWPKVKERDIHNTERITQEAVAIRTRRLSNPAKTG